ncbi:MAG: hypothetical protein Q9195_003527 [Heterodermia aff. obscurata]
MTREEIITNAGLLLVAGSETVATLLSGATYHLLRNPPVYTRLQTELRTAFPTEKAINFDSLARLPYLDAVLTESLRLYPPAVASLQRTTGPEGDLIAGNYIPPHTKVGVPQYASYHSRANFTDPESFVPERWLADPPPRYRADARAALQPFSVGPRNCLGRSLAWFEMRAILARVLWNFDMALCEESQDWAKQKSYLLWDKPALWVDLRRRA